MLPLDLWDRAWGLPVEWLILAKTLTNPGWNQWNLIHKLISPSMEQIAMLLYAIIYRSLWFQLLNKSAVIS